MTQHLIDWNSAYSIGLDEIDDQHKVLFDIINGMWASVINREKGCRCWMRWMSWSVTR